MTSAPARHPNAHWTKLDDEVLCYLDGALHRLDPSATLVWLLLDGTCSEADIVGALAQATGAPTERLQADVRTVLADLDGIGLLLA